MSHFEMEIKLQKILKISIACLLSVAPCFSQAAVPASYFPAYSFQLAQMEEIPSQERAPVALSENRSLEKARVFRQKRRPSSINRAAMMMAAPSKVFYGENGKALSPDLIANFYQFKATEKPMNMAEIIPMDMQPTDDSNQVLSRVADRTLTTFFNSKAVRESSLGRTATEVEKKMKQEVVLGGHGPKSIQHKLNFSLQAFQALAEVDYSGFTNAALKYKIAENKLAFEVFEKLSGNRDLVLSHTVARVDQVSEVSMRWTF